MGATDTLTALLCVAFVVTQVLYALAFCVDIYLFRLPIDRVDMREEEHLAPEDYPRIVLFYPVLRELEQTMRTTFISLRQRYQTPALRFGS